MKVEFLICGTQKGGTTALYQHLARHSSIQLAQQKEVHFFDREEFFRRGQPDYSPYHGCFPPAVGKRYGEATPIYMYWLPAIARIWHYNPQMRLIAVLRNPVERAYSHWNMEHSRGWDTLDFLSALEQEEARSRQALPMQHRVFSYVDRGFYSEQLRRLWRFFPREQVLVLKSDDLKQTPQPTLDRVCDFLAVPRLAHVEELHAHEGRYNQPMPDAARAYLTRIFEPEVRQLEQMLGWDCSDWIPPQA